MLVSRFGREAAQESIVVWAMVESGVSPRQSIEEILKNPRLCIYCGIPNSLYQCTQGCSEGHYCGVKCRTADWPEHKERCRLVLSHAVKNAQKKEGGDDIISARAYTDAGIDHFHHCRYGRAESYFLKAHRIYSAEFGDTHTVIAKSLQHFGKLYNAKQLYEEALVMLEESLRILNLIQGQSPNVGLALLDIGNVLGRQNKHEEALEMQWKAYGILEETLGKDHPDTALCLTGIGIVHTSMGQHETALEMQEKVLEIHRRAGNSSSGGGLERLAGALLFAGNDQAHLPGMAYPAEKKLREALELFRRIHGESHPLVAVALFYIGDLLRGQGQLDDALKVYKKSLDIKKLTLGTGHSLVANTMKAIASVYTEQCSHEAALAMNKQALAVCCRARGADHEDSAELRDLVEMSKSEVARRGRAAVPRDGSSRMLRPPPPLQGMTPDARRQGR